LLGNHFVEELEKCGHICGRACGESVNLGTVGIRVKCLDLLDHFCLCTSHEAIVCNSVAYPHRKNVNADADADPGKNLNADADSCPY
jgi:hypothetical protein